MSDKKLKYEVIVFPDFDENEPKEIFLGNPYYSKSYRHAIVYGKDDPAKSRIILYRDIASIRTKSAIAWEKEYLWELDVICSALNKHIGVE